MSNKELVDFSAKESQLVWNRYGCMVVANSILLGFIGQIATKKCYGGFLGIFACVIGLIIAFLWLFITSYGWSLSWYILKKSDAIELKVYQQWEDIMWRNFPKDPIWFCAHLVIFVFCLAYALLTFYFSKDLLLPVVIIIAFFIGGVFWFKIFFFDKTNDEQEQ